MKITASHGVVLPLGAKIVCESSHMVTWSSNSHMVELSPQVLTAAEVLIPGEQSCSCFWAKLDESVREGALGLHFPTLGIGGYLTGFAAALLRMNV